MGLTGRRIAPGALLAILLTGACATGGAPDTPNDVTWSTSATGPAGTGPAAASIPLEVTDCDSPPEDYQLLCDAYRIVAAHYVDPIDDERLAAGASRGVTELEVAEAASTAPETVTCAAPSDEFASFCEVVAREQAEQPATAADLIDRALHGMVEFGLADPFSSYLPPVMLAHFHEEQSGRFEGIGAVVRAEDTTSPDGATCARLSATCHLLVVSTLEGSPAAQAGVLAEDRIEAVEGQPVDGSTLDEIVAVVRGPAGTEVRLGIERNGTELELTVRRAAITLPVVESEMLSPDLGYLRLTAFTNHSDTQVREALRQLLADGAGRIVFDLQNNPGGSLETAVNIASEFLADGLVLRTRSPNRDADYEVRPGGAATDPNLEIFVLINRGSVSAAELVAAALQEADRATLIGEPTFGKNSVQQQFNLDNGGALKLTIARWVTAAGTDFGGEGVQPDIALDIPSNAGHDYVLERTLDLLGD